MADEDDERIDVLAAVWELVEVDEFDRAGAVEEGVGEVGMGEGVDGMVFRGELGGAVVGLDDRGGGVAEADDGERGGENEGEDEDFE